MKIRQGLYDLRGWFRQGLVLWRLRGYRILYPASGLGDLVIICNCVREYKKTHPNSRFALVLGERERMNVQLAGLFPAAFDRIAPFWNDPSRKCYFPKIEKFRLMVRTLPYSDEVEENFAQEIAAGFAYPHKCFDGVLPMKDSIRAFFEGDVARFVAGKTVLLCPAATSCGVHNDAWWVKLAAKLRDVGFCPVFNAKDDGKYKGFATVFLDLADTIGFAEMAGNVIGTRSGMCDIIAYFTRARLTVLWPDGNAQWSSLVRNRWVSSDGVFDFARFMNAWSVRRIFPRDGIREVVFDAHIKVERFVAELDFERKVT